MFLATEERVINLARRLHIHVFFMLAPFSHTGRIFDGFLQNILYNREAFVKQWNCSASLFPTELRKNPTHPHPTPPPPPISPELNQLFAFS